MSENKKTFGNDVRLGVKSEPENQIVKDTIPVTKPKLKCMLISDGVYKYVDENGKDIT